MAKACEYLVEAQRLYREEIDWVQGSYLVDVEDDGLSLEAMGDGGVNRDEVRGACLFGCVALAAGESSDDDYDWEQPAQAAIDWVKKVAHRRGAAGVEQLNDSHLNSKDEALEALGEAEELCRQQAVENDNTEVRDGA